jgi:hypothetical protein
MPHPVSGSEACMFWLGRGDPYRRKPRLHAQTFVCLFSYAFSHVQFPLNYILFSSSGDFCVYDIVFLTKSFWGGHPSDFNTCGASFFFSSTRGSLNPLSSGSPLFNPSKAATWCGLSSHDAFIISIASFPSTRPRHFRPCRTLTPQPPSKEKLHSRAST